MFDVLETLKEAGMGLLSSLTAWRAHREGELEQINRDFGSNPMALAQVYVESDCQLFNPAGFHELERHFVKPVREYLTEFFGSRAPENTGRSVLFILSDAGMGKSSLLIMLKWLSLRRPWAPDTQCHLLKLGLTTLEDLAKITERGRAVLLLDGLDEDPRAWGRLQERLGELLREAGTFKHAIITCRTAFFTDPDVASERPGFVQVGPFSCRLIYLCPFNDHQVQEYLARAYPAGFFTALFGGVHPRLPAAQELAREMKDLSMRPMLLAHLDDLLEAQRAGTEWNEYLIFRELLRCWVNREATKRQGLDPEVLTLATMQLAEVMQISRSRWLAADELQALVRASPQFESVRALGFGSRSLLNRTDDGHFRFAHYSLQEFLFVEAVLSGKTLRARSGGLLRELGARIGRDLLAPAPFTDQMSRFLRLGIKARPAGTGPGLDLSHLDLTGQDLTELPLDRSDFTESLMHRTRLAGSDLRNSRLRGCDLTRAALAYARVEGAHFQDACFHDVMAQGIRWDINTVWPEGFRPTTSPTLVEIGKPS